MPKIVINEYDKTKADVAEYSNFSVVVPGYVNSTVCTDTSKVFDENKIYECSSVSDFESKIGKVPASAQEIEAEGPTISELEETIDQEKFWGKYKYQLYTRESSAKGLGYLNDGTYKYILATTFDGGATYSWIKPGDEGHDASETPSREQCGNQIAYELLKNGYTVLYKLIDDTVSSGSTIEDLKTPNYWECLKDKATYDFRYITTGGYFNAVAYEQIVNIATFVNDNYITNKDNDITKQGRGDCIALVDIIEDGMTATTMSGILAAIKTQVNGWSWANKYTGIFVPQVNLDIAVDPVYQNVTFPASIYYLLCANEAFIVNDYSEWYAVAGYTRGTCSYKITGTTLGKFGEVAINTLEPRYSDSEPNKATNLSHSVNVIAKIRNNYYIWGNRTAHLLDTDGLKASHFLNIRQLLCTLKKELYVACRKFTFSPNSDLLWTNFCNTIRPTLEKMKADQGLRDYKIIKVATSTKALLKAKIRIVPIEAVEDFEMNISLEDSISGVSVGIDE